MTIAVTGATGHLGALILATLPGVDTLGQVSGSEVRS